MSIGVGGAGFIAGAASCGAGFSVLRASRRRQHHCQQRHHFHRSSTVDHCPSILFELVRPTSHQTPFSTFAMMAVARILSRHRECGASELPMPDPQPQIFRTFRLALRRVFAVVLSRLMKKKLRIGILFGGRSGEHEVSLLSAASILKAIDRKKYDVVPIGIDKQGRWLTGARGRSPARQPIRWRMPRTAPAPPKPPRTPPKPTPSSPPPPPSCAAASRFTSRRCPRTRATDSLAASAASAELAQPGNPLAASLDVVFPVLHGTFGEDGTIQGLFELADIAYVGSGVLGSSAAMDKDAMKRLFAAAGLPQTPYVTLLRCDWRSDPKARDTPDREVARLSALRQARESRQLGRHQQGP